MSDNLDTLPPFKAADPHLVIQVAEAMLFKSHVPVPNEITGEREPSELLFDGCDRYPNDGKHDFSDLLDLEGSDEDSIGQDPDFKKKAVLAGIQNTLEFSNETLGSGRFLNSLLLESLRETVRKTLVRLLAEWYKLEPSGAPARMGL